MDPRLLIGVGLAAGALLLYVLKGGAAAAAPADQGAGTGYTAAGSSGQPFVIPPPLATSGQTAGGVAPGSGSTGGAGDTIGGSSFTGGDLSSQIVASLTAEPVMSAGGPPINLTTPAPGDTSIAPTPTYYQTPTGQNTGPLVGSTANPEQPQSADVYQTGYNPQVNPLAVSSVKIGTLTGEGANTEFVTTAGPKAM